MKDTYCRFEPILAGRKVNGSRFFSLENALLLRSSKDLNSIEFKQSSGQKSIRKLQYNHNIRPTSESISPNYIYGYICPVYSCISYNTGCEEH